MVKTTMSQSFVCFNVRCISPCQTSLSINSPSQIWGQKWENMFKTTSYIVISLSSPEPRQYNQLMSSNFTPFSQSGPVQTSPWDSLLRPSHRNQIRTSRPMAQHRGFLVCPAGSQKIISGDFPWKSMTFSLVMRYPGVTGAAPLKR